MGWGQESRGVPTPRLPPPPTSGPRPRLSEAEPEAHLEPQCSQQTLSHRTSLGDWQGPWGQLPRFLGHPRSTSSPPRPSSCFYPRDPKSPHWLQPKPPRLGPGTSSISSSHSKAPPGVPWVPGAPQLTGQSGSCRKLRPCGHRAAAAKRKYQGTGITPPSPGATDTLCWEGRQEGPRGPAPPPGPATRPSWDMGERGTTASGKRGAA